MAGSVGSEPSKMRNYNFNLPCSSKCEKVQNDGLAMDIKGFDPFDTGAESVSNSVERSSPINTFPVGTLSQDMARVTETGVEMKGVHHSVKDLEEDEGYFSPYSKELKVEKKPSQSVYPLSQFDSSPFLSLRVNEHQPESSSESSCYKQALLSGLDASFAIGYSDAILSGPLLEHVNIPSEPKVKDLDELSNIHLPIFESSVCHSVMLNSNISSEQSRRVSEEVQGGIMEPVHEGRSSFSVEESTLDISYETTIPLKVQVSYDHRCRILHARNQY